MTAIAHDSRPQQTHADVTRDVVATLGTQSKGYVLMLLGAVVLFLVGLITFILLVKDGLGLAGYKSPVMWSVLLRRSCSGSVSATPAP